MTFFDPVEKNKPNAFKNKIKVATCKTKNATITLTATDDFFFKIC